jgi:hypothetical protein
MRHPDTHPARHRHAPAAPHGAPAAGRRPRRAFRPAAAGVVLLAISCAVAASGCRATGGLPSTTASKESAARSARPETAAAKSGKKTAPGSSSAARTASSKGGKQPSVDGSEPGTGSVRPAAGTDPPRRGTDERHALGTDADRAPDSENPPGWKNLWGKITGTGAKPPRIPLPRTDTPDRPAEDEPSVPTFGANDGP